jgi:phosphoadenosine phosphosulfate reductase
MTTTTLREQAPALARELEQRRPDEILAAIAPRFPRWIALATSFGAEDCVLLDVIARAHLPIEVFTVDTGHLFPETYALWTRLEQRYGIRIRAVRARVPAVEQGSPPPWERDPDACCAARKVEPLRSALAELGAWVTGIRREQTPERASARVLEWDSRFGLFKVNPLATWTRDDVAAYVRLFDVPTNPLHVRGYPSIGCAPCTTPVQPGEDPRSGRWRGHEKRECGLHVVRGAAVPPSPSPAPPAASRVERELAATDLRRSKGANAPGTRR